MTRYALYDIPIVTVTPIASGDDDVFLIDVSESGAYRLNVKKEYVIGGQSIIRLSGLTLDWGATNTMSRILIFMDADTSEGVASRIAAVSWQADGHYGVRPIISRVWKDGTIVNEVEDGFPVVVEIVIFGSRVVSQGSTTWYIEMFAKQVL